MLPWYGRSSHHTLAPHALSGRLSGPLPVGLTPTMAFFSARRKVPPLALMVVSAVSDPSSPCVQSKFMSESERTRLYAGPGLKITCCSFQSLSQPESQSLGLAAFLGDLHIRCISHCREPVVNKLLAWFLIITKSHTQTHTHTHAHAHAHTRTRTRTRTRRDS